MKKIAPYAVLAGIFVGIAKLYSFTQITLLLLLFFWCLLIGKKVKSILLVHSKMPTVWINISETIEIGKRYWFQKREISLQSISDFYLVMESTASLFEFKIDDQMILAFESKYFAEPPKDISTRTKARSFFVWSEKINPERLPEIAKAIQVRKKARGSKRKSKNEIEGELNPIYLK